MGICASFKLPVQVQSNAVNMKAQAGVVGTKFSCCKLLVPSSHWTQRFCHVDILPHIVGICNMPAPSTCIMVFLLASAGDGLCTEGCERYLQMQVVAVVERPKLVEKLYNSL
jgi:hypothetical protein